MRRHQLFGLLLGTLVLTGCSTVQSVRDTVSGWVFGDRREEVPQVRETRWVLIRNPRFQSTVAEPEYVWVEDDKIPTTLNTMLFGQKSVLAPPDVVVKYGALGERRLTDPWNVVRTRALRAASFWPAVSDRS